MKLTHIQSNRLIACNVIKAHNVLTRLRGLLFRKELEKGSCLWLRPCNSIHSFMMGYAFDALFLDKEHRVVHVIHSMKPNRVSPIVWKAHSIVEFPAGTLKSFCVEINDPFCFSDQ